jgi:hypothetical protein
MRVSISTRSAFHYETATLPSRYIYISSILFPLHQQQQPAKLFLEGKKEKRRDVYCISLILISYNNSNQMCPRSYTYIYKDATWMPGATHMQLLLPSPTGFENNHLHSRSFHTPSPLSTVESSIFLVTSREINKRWFTIFLANDATENKKRSFGL